jgi:hypothetical protein
LRRIHTKKDRNHVEVRERDTSVGSLFVLSISQIARSREGSFSLDYKSLKSALLVCKRWSRLVLGDVTWQHLVIDSGEGTWPEMLQEYGSWFKVLSLCLALCPPSLLRV